MVMVKTYAIGFMLKIIAVQLMLWGFISKFFETNPIWTSLTTLDAGVFIEVNQAFLEVTGCRKEEDRTVQLV